MMDLKEQFAREILESYFTRVISRLLPIAVKNALKESGINSRQEFVSIKKACSDYGVSSRTLYNYHKQGHITLRKPKGKTFVSVFELEEHIKNNPIPRNPE